MTADAPPLLKIEDLLLVEQPVTEFGIRQALDGLA